jgi:hypothetical protein
VDGLRARRRGEQGTQAAIRMGDEVRTVTERLGNVASVDFEILPIGGRALAEPAAIQDEEGPAIGQRVLGLPRRGPARDAPVYEQDPRSITAPLDVQMGHSLGRAPASIMAMRAW